MSRKTYLNENISEKDLIYAAGFFDGEGTVQLNRYKRNKKGDACYRLCVSVSNTKKEVIDWFKETFGTGCVHPIRKFKKGGNPGWRWLLYSRRASKFLQMIYPYLKVKKDDAEIGILFQDFINKRKPHSRQTLSEKKFILSLIERLRNLPHRKKSIFSKIEYL
jgi:hypothetical protein